MSKRTAVVAGAILLLVALVLALLGWADDPQDAAAEVVFVGTTGAIGLALLVVGIVQ